jgi:hypothetical protein
VRVAAEEVEALLAIEELDPPRLVRVQREPETPQDHPDAFLGPLAILRGAAHHHEVVRVAHQRPQGSAVAHPQDVEHIVALRFGRKPYETGRKSASNTGASTSFAAISATRSRTVGIPSGRFLPSAFGMYRRRTNLGRYSPVRSSLASLSRKLSTPLCSTSRIDWLSTPAAPRLRLTHLPLAESIPLSRHDAPFGEHSATWDNAALRDEPEMNP